MYFKNMVYSIYMDIRLELRVKELEDKLASFEEKINKFKEASDKMNLFNIRLMDQSKWIKSVAEQCTTVNREMYDLRSKLKPILLVKAEAKAINAKTTKMKKMANQVEKVKVQAVNEVNTSST